jgi:hypothetical protein
VPVLASPQHRFSSRAVAKQKEVLALARKEVERETMQRQLKAKKERYIEEIFERKSKMKYDREIEDLRRRFETA